MLASGGRGRCGVGDVHARTFPWGQTDTLDSGGGGVRSVTEEVLLYPFSCL